MSAEDHYQMDQSQPIEEPENPIGHPAASDNPTDEHISSPRPLALDSNKIPLLRDQEQTLESTAPVDEPEPAPAPAPAPAPETVPAESICQNVDAARMSTEAQPIETQPPAQETTHSAIDSGPDGRVSIAQLTESAPAPDASDPMQTMPGAKDSSENDDYEPTESSANVAPNAPPPEQIDSSVQQPSQSATDASEPSTNALPSNVDLQKLLATLSPAPPNPNNSAMVPNTETTAEPIAPQYVPPPHTGSAEHADVALTPEEEAAFERFVEDERDYVTRGQWDRFPVGSRLFIGNLPSEKVEKRDVFKLFSKHGRLAQISIKQAYGFVQFYSAADASAAIAAEQGSSLAGRAMHLEVSKPQKPRNQGRRSRSPDRRARSPRRRDRGYSGHDDRDAKRRRDDDYGKRSPRFRDESYGAPAPGRFRSPSPPRALPPPRPPHAVPDVQLIITEEVDRGFVYFVENAFLNKRLRVDILNLSPRWPLPEVVKQMVLEGVHEVVFLNRTLQSMNKVSTQVFDRRGGVNNVRFDEYQNIDITVAVELANRTKANVVSPPYSAGAPAAPAGAVNPNIASLISSLDPATLQRVLGSLQQPQPSGGYGTSYAAVQPQGYNGLSSNPVLQQLLGGGAGQPSATPQQQQNVQNIMQQLSRLQNPPSGGMR